LQLDLPQLNDRLHPILAEKQGISLAAGTRPNYKLGFNMRSFVAIFLMAITFWQVTSGSPLDLATATLSVAAAWFVSLFIAD
jgi:hypothetical protein